VAKAIPTERELQALKILWDRGEATVQKVCDHINAGAERLAYTTVLSLFQAMEQKGLVRHRRVGKAYVYTARVARTSTIRGLASRFLDNVFDGALDQYVAHALRSRDLRPGELEQLERIIAEAKRGAGGKPEEAGDA
jgi:predicted transcriptional regulator